MTAASTTGSLPHRARPAGWRVSAALTCLVAGCAAWAAQPPSPPAPGAPAAPGLSLSAPSSAQALRHFALKVDGHTLQLEAQSLDIDAQTIEASGKTQTLRGNVRIQLQLARDPEHPQAAAPEQGGTAGNLTLILQADAIDLTQPPVRINVRPGSRCSITLQDHSGRQLWRLAGAKCSLQGLEDAQHP